MATIRELQARFTAQANGLRATLRNAARDIQSFGRDSQRSVEGTNESVRDLQSEMQRVQREAQDLGSETSDAMREVQRSARRTNDELENLGRDNGLSDVNDELENANENLASVGASTNVGGLGNIFVGFGKIRMAALGAVAAVGGAVVGLIAMVKQGDELQKALNGLEAATGATKEEMAGMEESLLNLYRNNYGVSFQDIADSMALVKQNTGASGIELENLTKRAILLRDAMQIDVAESTKVADTMMKQFGISGEQAMTLIAQGQQEGLNKSEDMLDSFNEYSVYFKQLGFDAEGMWNVFKAGADGGAFNMDKVGDSIKEFGIRVKDGSKTTNDAFASLGMDANVMAQSFAKGGESSQKALQSVFSELGKIEDPVKRNTIGVQLFGTQFEDLEYKTIISLGNVQNQANITADTLGKMDKVKYDTFGEALAGMGRIIQTDLLIPIEQKMMPVLNNAANYLKDNIPSAIDKVKNAFNAIKTTIIEVWGFLEPYIMPIIQQIVAFIGEKVNQIKQFWDENGAQIMQAVKNAFDFILSIIKFVMPAILFIIDMIWGNIKGVINGALNIIMGLIKIFAGIFTGDFSKMWEGIKQLFFGAIEFVWNLINLLMIGRILGGIKAFISAGIKSFTSFWDDTLNIFKNLDQSVSNVVNRFIGFLKNSWNTAKDEAVSVFTNIKNWIAKIWDDIVDGAKGLPQRVGDGIKNMAENAVSGAISLANKLLKKIGGGVNGVIGGINWVLNKIDVDNKIPEWDIPQYAKGTKGHPGGLAIVGEEGPELVNLPKGTSVLPNKQTTALLGMSIPGYAKGVGDFFKSLMDGPKKMIEKLWEEYIPKISDIGGAFGDIAKGSISYLKDKAFGFLKNKLDGFMSFGGSGGNVPGNVQSWIRQAMAITGVPDSWFGSLVTMAMKESGGRTGPSTINKWDSNWRKGTPSMGLMQTIMPTFMAYKLPGLNDIMNPVHNAVAAIRYILKRYGTVFNTPGIKSMMNGGPYKGYFEGARVAMKQLAWIAEKGAEYIIPTDGSQNAYKLWIQAGLENGFSDGQTDSTPSASRIENVSKQPLLLQLVTPDSRVFAEWVVDDITDIQDFKTNRKRTFEGR